jgi:hypothetical protein
MIRVCSTNVGEEECIYDIGGESQKEGDHKEDQDVGGWTLLKRILERLGILWIELIGFRYVKIIMCLIN